MINMIEHAEIAFLLFLASFIAVHSLKICQSSNNVFTVKVDLFASELGYFYFEECGDTVNPTLGLEVGETYTFLQTDRSNYMHPLGFAYFPDGDHDGKPELEPTIASSFSLCGNNETCPAPQYSLGRNDDADSIVGRRKVTLENYENIFKLPISAWAKQLPYAIQLRFDDDQYKKDIFYFCHVHQYMSGRIKLMKGSDDFVDQSTDPVIEYNYDEPSTFDKECGTFGLEPYQLPNDHCPETFVCDIDSSDSDSLKKFSGCLNAMNCAMLTGMIHGSQANSPIATFIYQMIPHHQAAVNMAKSLLKFKETDPDSCTDLSDETDPACFMELMARSIINGQNHQIQLMRQALATAGMPATADTCEVTIQTSNII